MLQPVKFFNSVSLLSLFVIVTLKRIFLLKIAFQYFRATVKVNLKTTVSLKPQSAAELQTLAKSNFKIKRSRRTFTDQLFGFSLVRSSSDKNLNQRPGEQLQSWELSSISSTFYFIFLNKDTTEICSFCCHYSHIRDLIVCFFIRSRSRSSFSVLQRALYKNGKITVPQKNRVQMR